MENKTVPEQSQSGLETNSKRFALFPIQDIETWKLYEKQRDHFWVPGIISFAKDYEEFTTLFTKDQQHSIKRILGIFATADGIIAEDIEESLLPYLKDDELEKKMLLDFKKMMEGVHNNVYSIAVDVYIKDVEEKQQIFDAVKNIESIKHIKEFIDKWKKHESFGLRLLLQAFVENNVFSGLFAFIFGLRRYYGDALSGLTHSNEYIARDEGYHYEAGIHMYNTLDNDHPKPNKEEILQMIKEGVDVIAEFNKDTITNDFAEITREKMDDYAKYMADIMLNDLGIEILYNVELPFAFMMDVGAPDRYNFFEKSASNYKQASQIKGFKRVKI